ncbi:hypothetical protein T484DRAFT_1773829 [Baffinella frigidus]|nr:hypothetical protein T484DRAFT_1773829 [Cryptophyta sp. CCMP2293]
MRTSTRCACALIAIVVLGLATQAKGQETEVDENQTAADEIPCTKDVYTENCTDTCTMAGTCNNQGRCRGQTGLCECFEGWSGADCNTTDGDGDAPRADPCVKDMYAAGCTAECSMAGTCNNHGRCMGDGSCLCFAGFSGADCNTGEDNTGDASAAPCVKDMYYTLNPQP